METISREKVDELLRLAEERTDRARSLLIEQISDLFISEEGRLTEHQRALMSDILLKLVSELEIVVRKDLSARLADQDSVPHDLVMELANDRIDIARPVLQKSGALKDEDLIEVVRNRTDEYRLCIAMREKLSEQVSDAIVESGGVDVIEALLRNQDADLSKRAMEYLVAESRRVDRFQEPLLSRHDLPPTLAHRMFWWVSAALKKKILLEYKDIDPIAVDQAIQGAARQAIDDHSESEGIMARARALVARLAATGALDVKFLTQALRQQRIPVFIAGIAQLVGIETAMAWRIFLDKTGESFAVLCRAMEMNRNDFSSLYLLLGEARGGGRVRATDHLKEILELYDSVDLKTAQAALSFWQRDGAYQEALQGLKDVH